MWGLLTKQWFLIALAICFATAYLLAETLAPLLEMTILRGSIVFVVMWAMGVTLKADTIRQSIHQPIPSLLAITINMLVVPLLCIPTQWVLPPHLFGGLFVAAIVPCTLASASVWTRKANGDDSIAMMTTVVTNLACIAVVPIGISLVLSQQAQVDAMMQIKKLSILVVLPLVLAQIMRRVALAPWADRNKSRISVFSQIGILAMVVFGAVASGNFLSSDKTSSTTWIAGIVIVSAAAAIHVGALWLGIVVAKRTGQTRDRQIAVGIAGSQKTLMVGLQIAIDCGVSVIPMLIYHFNQLVIDTIIAARWKDASSRQSASSETPED
ncbi:MAG: transporter [Pirellulaceae bacterium]|nr:transporter [Pirellulaceae bacterium]